MKLVNDPAELEALGEGWADTPAAFAAAAEAEALPAATTELDEELELDLLDSIDEPEAYEGGKEPETDPAAAEAAPKADPPANGRCACGKYSAKYAAKNKHVCEG